MTDPRPFSELMTEVDLLFEERIDPEQAIEVGDANILLRIEAVPDSHNDSELKCSLSSCQQRFRSQHCLQVHEYACHYKPPTLAKPTRIDKEQLAMFMRDNGSGRKDDIGSIILPMNP